MKGALLFLFLVLMVVPQGVLADGDMEQAKAEALAMKERITAECMADPYSCSCDRIPCEDILEADDPRAGEAYDRCVKERAGCNEQRLEGIRKMEEQKSRIEAECRKDLNDCDCSEVDNPQGRAECELAMIDARYQAQKEKNDKITECITDLDACDCSEITNDAGRAECEVEVRKGRELKARLEAACTANPFACDCSEIEVAEGRAECESKKQAALSEIDAAILAKLSACFRDVDSCDCTALGLDVYEKRTNDLEGASVPEGAFTAFCEVQKSYGIDCKYKGLYCEKLEDTEIYPVGMPPWLGKIFAKAYSDHIEKEKSKGTKEAAKIITRCINDPGACDCGSVPDYASPFCERMKGLQIRCYDGDYTACMTLDESPNLPEGMPYFTIGTLDTLINSLRNARGDMVKGSAARKVGSMILECMDDADKCDCSIAPQGRIRAFCEHKKELVYRCRELRDYEACFQLDEEPVIDKEIIPGFIAGYVEKNTVPKVEEKKKAIFNEMKQGTICQDMTTMQECKTLYYSGKHDK